MDCKALACAVSSRVRQPMKVLSGAYMPQAAPLCWYSSGRIMCDEAQAYVRAIKGYLRAPLLGTHAVCGPPLERLIVPRNSSNARVLRCKASRRRSSRPCTPHSRVCRGTPSVWPHDLWLVVCNFCFNSTHLVRARQTMKRRMRAATCQTPWRLLLPLLQLLRGLAARALRALGGEQLKKGGKT